MDFIKKYWWVFAILGALVALYFLVWNKPKAPAGPTCATSLEEWQTRFQGLMDQIDNDPNWKAQIMQQVGAGNRYPTYEIGREKSATYYLTEVMKICKPAGA